MPDADPDAARSFATARHEGQRYGDQPYTVHLAATVAVLREYGIDDPELVCAAWLHDVIEDTDATLAEVAARFGERVAALVAAVTDDDGDTRAARKAEAYVRIAATPGATLVKLADRIANVRASWASRSRMLFVYHREYPAFRAAIESADPPPAEVAMWAELDRLMGARR